MQKRVLFEIFEYKYMNDQGVPVLELSTKNPQNNVWVVCVCVQCKRACAVLESQPAETDVGSEEKKK